MQDPQTTFRIKKQYFIELLRNGRVHDALGVTLFLAILLHVYMHEGCDPTSLTGGNMLTNLAKAQCSSFRRNIG